MLSYILCSAMEALQCAEEKKKNVSLHLMCHDAIFFLSGFIVLYVDVFAVKFPWHIRFVRAWVLNYVVLLFLLYATKDCIMFCIYVVGLSNINKTKRILQIEKKIFETIWLAYIPFR